MTLWPDGTQRAIIGHESYSWMDRCDEKLRRIKTRLMQSAQEIFADWLKTIDEPGFPGEDLHRMGHI